MARKAKNEQQSYWTTVKYRGKCGGCGAPVAKGERALYFPGSRSVLCNSAQCGWVADPVLSGGAR